MSKPKIPKTPDAPQPDAPAAKLVQPLTADPLAALTKKNNLRKYLTAGPAAPVGAPPGVGVNL